MSPSISDNDKHRSISGAIVDIHLSIVFSIKKPRLSLRGTFCHTTYPALRAEVKIGGGKYELLHGSVVYHIYVSRHICFLPFKHSKNVGFTNPSYSSKIESMIEQTVPFKELEANAINLRAIFDSRLAELRLTEEDVRTLSTRGDSRLSFLQKLLTEVEAEEHRLANYRSYLQIEDARGNIPFSIAETPLFVGVLQRTVLMDNLPVTVRQRDS